MKSKRPPASEPSKPKSMPNSKKTSKRKRTRKPRSRPIPKWLESDELEEIAQRRCLMILSVLSGEKPVTEAIKEAGITRPLYYLLERRAVEAMLEALLPSSPGRKAEPSSQIRGLEEKIQQLEKEKRRMERLLLLTRKVLKPGPLKTARGRPRKRPSTSSPTTASSDEPAPSIPTKPGETTP